METRCKEEAYNEVLTILDSMQEESVSEELEEVAKKYGIKKHPMTTTGANESACDFKAGTQWKEEQMMTKAIDATCFGVQDAALFSFRLPASSYLIGSKVKVIVIKED
jgi:hypothetical protein